MFQVTVNADVMTMLRLILLMFSVVNVFNDDCLDNEDDVPPVGHDLDSGDDAYWSKKPRPRHRSWDMQRRAAKRNEYNPNIVKISRFQELVKQYRFWKDRLNTAEIIHLNSPNKSSFNLKFDVDLVIKMVVGIR